MRTTPKGKAGTRKGRDDAPLAADDLRRRTAEHLDGLEEALAEAEPAPVSWPRKTTRKTPPRCPRCHKRTTFLPSDRKRTEVPGWRFCPECPPTLARPFECPLEGLSAEERFLAGPFIGTGSDPARSPRLLASVRWAFMVGIDVEDVLGRAVYSAWHRPNATIERSVRSFEKNRRAALVKEYINAATRLARTTIEKQAVKERVFRTATALRMAASRARNVSPKTRKSAK